MNTLLIKTEVDNDYRNYNLINLQPEITTEKGTIYKSSGRHFINRSEYMELCGLLSNETSTIAERPNFSYIPVYFDIDLKSKEKKKLYTEEQVKQIIERINQVLPRFYDITQENFKCALLEKQIYKSGEYYKNGFHLHYPCIFVNRDFFIKKVFPIITEEVKKHVHMDLDYIYSNGWLMYNCSKKPNLKPYLVTKFYDYNCKVMTVLDALKDYHIYDSNEDLISITEENHMTKLSNVFSLNLWNRNEYITEVKNNELLEFLQVQQQKKIEKEERKKKYADNRDFSEKVEDIKKYLPLITQNSEYRIWYDVAQAIYNELDGTEEGLDLFIEWSKYADNFDEYACERLYNSLKSTNSTIGTIKHLAKEYSPQEYAQLNSKQKIVFVEKEEEEEINTDYCYTNFDMDRRKVFDSYEELMAWFKRIIPHVLIKINSGKGCYLKNEHNEQRYNAVCCYDLNKSVNFYYNSTDVKGNKTITTKKTVKLGELFEDSSIQTYSRIACKPNNNINQYEFNIWEKFKADVKIDVDMDKLNPLFDYILDILCDNNEILFKYIISWVRHICKYPHKKTKKVLVFQSNAQQAGKGSFINWLMYSVFGKQSSYATSVKKLTGNFNSFLMQKSLIIVDELPTTQNRFHNTFDTLKNLITEPYLDIEFKGKETFQTDNLCNFIFSTNNEKSIKLEKHDERYVIFKINEKRVGDHTFWANMHTNVFTHEVGIHFFNYLINIPDDDERLVSIQIIPETELNIKMKKLSMNSMESFINILKSRDDDELKLYNLLNTEIESGENGILLKDIPCNIQLKIKKQPLYEMYLNWCKRTGETEMKQKYFNTLLDEKRISQYRFFVI